MVYFIPLNLVTLGLHMNVMAFRHCTPQAWVVVGGGQACFSYTSFDKVSPWKTKGKNP